MAVWSQAGALHLSKHLGSSILEEIRTPESTLRLTLERTPLNDFNLSSLLRPSCACLRDLCDT